MGNTHSAVVYEASLTQETVTVILTCGIASTYVGSVDTSSCVGITGWVADRNRLSVP